METGFLEKVVLEVDPERWSGFGGRAEQGEHQAKQTRGSVSERGTPTPVTCLLCSGCSVNLCLEEGREGQREEESRAGVIRLSWR